MDAVSAATQSGESIATIDKGFGALDSDEFTKLILTELGNQDPLEPNDTKALLEQLSIIRSIESDTKLNDTLKEMTDPKLRAKHFSLKYYGVPTPVVTIDYIFVGKGRGAWKVKEAKVAVEPFGDGSLGLVGAVGDVCAVCAPQIVVNGNRAANINEYFRTESVPRGSRVAETDRDDRDVAGTVRLL